MSKELKISFRVTDEENRKIREAAKKKNLSLSTYVLDEIGTNKEMSDPKLKVAPKEIILIIDEINRLEKRNPGVNFKPLRKEVRNLWQQ